MRVLIHLPFPPRARHLAGGAQQLVHDLIHGMVQMGLLVDIVCPQATGEELIELGSTLNVEPVLHEAQETPSSPAQRCHNLRHLAQAAALADVVLSVDRTFPLPVDQPVVLLLNNFSYGTEVDSVFSLTWDTVVVPSPCLAEAVRLQFGPKYWRGGVRAIEVVSPGVDSAHFRPTDAAVLRSALGLRPEQRCLVFPHRPDPGKGFGTALLVLGQLRAAGHDLTLLVPRPPQSVRAVRQREALFHEALRHQVRALALEEAVVFHDWIEHDQLPAYYSLAERCLVLSELPEAFGFAALQAVSCGTPVIATPAGAMADLLPCGHGLALVPARQIDKIVSALLDPPEPDAVARGQRVIQHRYSIPRFINNMIACLCHTTKSAARYDPLGCSGSHDRSGPTRWLG
ncbi:MAG: glycosyltransferase family 4 protein [Egibacteraceae bacterium]